MSRTGEVHLFASDLHLSLARPEKLAQFAALVDWASVHASAVFLLGDLVEAWLGDDDHRPPNNVLVSGLARLTSLGIPITVVHGNRDFLMGKGFVADTGVHLVPEQAVVDLFGQPTLIMHGDSLCTHDTSYQAIRRQLRSPEWQAQVLSQSLDERIRLAQQMRDTSIAMSAEKDLNIMDVSPDEVVRVMRASGVYRLIHGHTHRPGRHSFAIDQRPAERIVLGDWYDSQDTVACVGPDTLDLLSVQELLARP